MALSQRTVNRHNVKRAEVFAANGLSNLDVQYAHPNFEGYGHGTCALCGKQHLKWLFSIKFDAPSGIVALAKIDTDIIRDSEVTLQPIGSKCITDWLDAVPETAEKLEALKRWEIEMRRCKAAMKAKVIEDLARENGFADAADAVRAYRDYTSTFEGRSMMGRILPRSGVKRLARNANKFRNGTLSRGTAVNWMRDLMILLYTPIRRAPRPVQTRIVPVAKPAKPATPTLSIADEDLMERGRVAWKDKSLWSRLTRRQQSDFVDIGQKVVKFGSFRSTAQRRYYSDMLKKLEAAQ